MAFNVHSTSPKQTNQVKLRAKGERSKKKDIDNLQEIKRSLKILSSLHFLPFCFVKTVIQYLNNST